MTDEKRCFSCDQNLPASEFGKHSAQKDELQSSCKRCTNQKNSAWIAANREKRAATAAAYSQANLEKLRAYKAAWFQANKDRIAERGKEAQRARRAKNRKPPRVAKGKDPIKRKEACARYYQRHAGQIKIKRRVKYQENPSQDQAYLAKRRGTKLQATVLWANDFFIKEAYRLAVMRTRIFGFKWDVDHIVPLQSPFVCGLHWEQNLQVIPRAVNVRKSNRYWPGMP